MLMNTNSLIVNQNIEAFSIPLDEGKRAAYAQMFGLKEAKHNSLMMLLQNLDPTNWLRIAGQDHASLWLLDKIPYSYVIQPYKNSLVLADAEIAWDAFCLQWGLIWKMLPEGTGWYNSSRTVCVEFTRDRTIWDGKKELTEKLLMAKLGYNLICNGGRR